MRMQMNETAQIEYRGYTINVYKGTGWWKAEIFDGEEIVYRTKGRTDKDVTLAVAKWKIDTHLNASENNPASELTF